MSYCKVQGCRYPQSHLSSAHRCGTCGSYGHGQIECKSSFAKQQLRNIIENESYLSEEIQCSIKGCIKKWSHTTQAHHCFICGSRGKCIHCEEDINNVKFVTCPTCKKQGFVDLDMEIYTGTDCCICFEATKMVIFSMCKHANICVNCVIKI